MIDSIAPDVRSAIEKKLTGLEERENVRILFAVESGSRAWGFPSPDSDYDARFVYVRPLDWYLSITPGRDVIELPIEGDLDINGWDIQKALSLILKPNPVLLEWLSSPIRYTWNADVCDQLIAFSNKIAHNRTCVHHYLGLGEGNFKRAIDGRDLVSLKKYFYVLRPAMALRWVRMNTDVIPPMHFQTLMEGVDLPADLVSLIDDLLVKKSETKEMGEAPRLPALEAFILAEFEHARLSAGDLPKPTRNHVAEANAMFRAIVKGFDPTLNELSTPKSPRH